MLELPQDVRAGKLLLGIAADGSRLLVPFAPDAHRAFKIERKSRGIRLLLRQLEEEDGNRWYLDVVCTRDELRWLFSSFLADILLRIEHRPDVDPPVIVRSCYSAWRALFAAAGPRMTVKQLAGLYGELTVLERLMGRSPDAIGRWRGPLADPHDFVAPGLDAEVKTTLSSEDSVVHIHGITQLAPPDSGELRLAHIRVETPSPDGETVEDLIARLTDLDEHAKLPGLLAAAGYGSEERDMYGGLTLRIVDEHWYAVTDPFPRLTPASFPSRTVPDGLDDFRYTLDLARITALPLAADEVDETLGRLAG